MFTMRLPARLLVLATLAACSGSPPSALDASHPLGPDAGAGCDSTIHEHCVFPQGIGDPDLGPACVEYSGASPDHSQCLSANLVMPPGQYGTGPCPRDQYGDSCVELDPHPAADAGACAAFMRIWASSPDWHPDAGIPGLPPCMNR